MKKFFKKPLNVVSLILAVLGLVGMIVILCVPHGGKYTYTKKEDGKTYKAIYVLKDGNLYSNTAVDGEWTTKEDKKVGKYRITKGNLSYSITGTAYIDFAKINSFKMTLSNSDESLTCTASVTFFVVACVMLALGAVGMVYGAVAKPKKKRK